MAKKRYFELIHGVTEEETSKKEIANHVHHVRENENDTRVSVQIGGYRRPDPPKPRDAFNENMRSLVNTKQLTNKLFKNAISKKEINNG